MQIVSNKTFSTATLRRGLVEDLAALREGKISRSESRARAYTAKAIIESMKLEMLAEHMKVSEFKPVDLLEAA